MYVIETFQNIIKLGQKVGVENVAGQFPPLPHQIVHVKSNRAFWHLHIFSLDEHQNLLRIIWPLHFFGAGL